MRRLLLLAACSALLLAACGSDEGGSTGPADAGLQVLVKPTVAVPGETIRAYVVNGSEEKFSYDPTFELERQMGQDFIAVKLPDRPVQPIAYIAEPGETGPPVQVKIPGQALPGQYRVVIQRDVPDVGDLSGEFEVKRRD